jgi:hypothetical protein
MKRKHSGNTDSLADSSRANTSNQKLPEGDSLVHRFDAGPLPAEECYGNEALSDQGIKSTNCFLLLSYQFYRESTICR